MAAALARLLVLTALGGALVLAAFAAHAQAPGGAAAEKRLALVIGNSAYPTSRLRNPVNDAQSLSAVLRERGFDVLVHQNVTQKEMRRAILDFGNRLSEGGVGLFYFAGHGIRVSGRNYLVPVDAVIGSEGEVEVEAIDMSAVVAKMVAARTRLNLVIIDACRDNPVARSFRSDSKGLALVEAPSHTLIAYATSPGAVSRDGDGANGLYTSELVKAIRVPGLKVEDVFKRVRQAVQEQSRGEQIPLESSGLVGDFMFSAPAAPAAVAAAPAPADTSAPRSVPTALAGTTWTATTSLGDASEFVFEPNGKLRMTPLRGGRSVGGTWVQRGEVLYMEIAGGYSTWNGLSKGGRFEGTATNLEGRNWTWTLTRP